MLTDFLNLLDDASEDKTLSAQGCFADSDQTRDLVYKAEIDDVTVDKCIHACRDYAYAGVQVSVYD